MDNSIEAPLKQQEIRLSVTTQTTAKDIEQPEPLTDSRYKAQFTH